MHEDWHLIESSMAKQYGIRIRQEKHMPWSEFVSLVSGLMADTPLGQIVAIRAEKDPKAIKSFTVDQRRIYNDWRSKSAKKHLENPEKLDQQMDEISKMLALMFGKGG
ncbi:Gp15 family bacteriophage protein [Cohnella abietis]|uniref:Bacteriophage Gp15 protein n=1 Tax=Cohnella abietis TaxID=2507935 RepID=A0A3T1D2W6_9BACL|nr:Gp15 family bacteriophage protein [Cohnella abietis]BBI32369.1 hypothetical protein KCTCHS21_17680 [Cohnella abietis]